MASASRMPRIYPPKIAPFMLPSPPMTTMTKALRMRVLPISGAMKASGAINTAAAAAVLMAPLAFIAPEMGSTLILKAFVIVVIGGLGSMKGAIFGGYILGILEALAIAYVSSAYKDVFAFG